MMSVVMMLIIFAQAPSESAPVRLGETHVVEVKKSILRIKLEKNASLSDELWTHYSLRIQIENNSSDLVKVDQSKFYLVDDTGLHLFSFEDDLKLTEQLLKEGERVIERFDVLFGRRTAAEMSRTRRAIEARMPEEAKLVEIPPGAKQEVRGLFHTRLRPKWITVSLFGIKVASDLLQTPPIRFSLEE